jgi:hypothetical protein
MDVDDKSTNKDLSVREMEKGFFAAEDWKRVPGSWGDAFRHVKSRYLSDMMIRRAST